jgi:hypothetical protein
LNDDIWWVQQVALTMRKPLKKKKCNHNFFSLAECIGVGTLAASTLIKLFVEFLEFFTIFLFFKEYFFGEGKLEKSMSNIFFCNMKSSNLIN